MPNPPPTEAPNTRAGFVLFAIYLAAYGGFVALNAFDPAAMERPSLGGVNLAIGYGVGLIAGAFALAMVYVWLCRRPGPAGGQP